MSVNSSGPLEKVTGVGLENSLRLTMSPMYGGRSVKYRIYISEIGTTRSKVILKKKMVFEELSQLKIGFCGNLTRIY